MAIALPDATVAPPAALPAVLPPVPAKGATVLSAPLTPAAAAAAVAAPCSVQCRAAQALKQSSHPALRRLRVEETGESIIISGRVSTYYLKQLAQETIMSVRRDLALVNQVTVGRE